MVFAETVTKAGWLTGMQRMFATRPNRGFRTAEIAERLGIAPRTVRKYITEMSASGRLPVILDEREQCPGRRNRGCGNALCFSAARL